MAEINKILPPSPGGPGSADETGIPTSLPNVENATNDPINNRTFQNPMTAQEMGDALYLGAGPHGKERASLKVCDSYPNRAMINTGTPEYFIDQTIKVYWDSTWLNSAHVRLQADSASDLSTNTAMGINLNVGSPWTATQIEWTITFDKTLTTWTGSCNKFNGYSTKYVNLNEITNATLGVTQSPNTKPFTTAGTGYYTIRLRLKSSSPSTTCQMTTPLYISGVAPQSAPWSGVPVVDGSGRIYWDATIKMPEVPGVDDWDIEMAEI